MKTEKHLKKDGFKPKHERKEFLEKELKKPK
jgi:hypothetical protein